MNGRYSDSTIKSSPPRRSSLSAFRQEKRDNDARSLLNRSDSSIEVRTPIQQRLRRLQSNLKDEQIRKGLHNVSNTTAIDILKRDNAKEPQKMHKSPPTPMVISPQKRGQLKRRSDQYPNDVDMENTTKKLRMDKSPSPNSTRRINRQHSSGSSNSRLSLPGPGPSHDVYENDIEMTDATIQKEITSLREEFTTVRSDYSLSMTINAENRLVIKYKDFNEPPEDTASSLQKRLMSRQSNAATLHIVVDTNIFIKDLSVVSKLMERKFPGELGYPILVIPYIVLKELENLAHRNRGKEIEKSAKDANKFINNQFTRKNPQLKGQNSADHSMKLVEVQSGDDDVLNCCLQVKQSGKKVILLSNDVNLRNKALFNDVPAYSIQGMDKKDLKFEIEDL